MSDDWKTCTIDECIKPARSRGGRHCEMHYYRLRRTGTSDQLRPWNHREGTCCVDGCDEPVNDRWGMCRMHATRVARHGDPDVVIHQKDRDLPRGERHPYWTGDEATYDAVHQRVEAERGKASAYPCADCGNPAVHWSYDHSDPDERISDDGRPFSLDGNCYEPRCASCHKMFDYSVLRAKGRVGMSPRCGKPMAVRKGRHRVSDISDAPVCGKPEGHGGPCRSVESYQHILVRGAQLRRAS